MRVFVPGDFGVSSDNIKPLGSAVTGPPSWSGIRQTLKTDGGPRWYGDLGDAAMIDRDVIIKWRAMITAMDDGATPFILALVDRRHQPVSGRRYLPIDDQYTPYEAAGAYATAVGSAALRSTTLTALVKSELPLIGGERFAVKHSVWGWRAYQLIGVGDSGANKVLTFRPPLRQAITNGTVIEFDTPRCVMQMTGDNPGSPRQGRFGSGQLSLVEYMQPAT